MCFVLVFLGFLVVLFCCFGLLLLFCFVLCFLCGLWVFWGICIGVFLVVSSWFFIVFLGFFLDFLSCNGGGEGVVVGWW